MPDAPDPSPCLSPTLLEAAASNATLDEASGRHLRECPRCQMLVRQIRDHNKFLNELLAAAQDDRTATRIAAGPAIAMPGGSIPVPGYEILGEISRGGQGVVYRAVQTSTRRRVALKMPLSGTLLTATDRRRFENEITLAARLRHPYIVTVHDSGLTPDGRFFVAMELVSGQRLDDWSRRLPSGPGGGDGPGVNRTRLELMAKVCDAVQYAHQRGIMHRDLKPGNIMVDAEGIPRLLDFGIARTMLRRSGDTLTGQMVGTLAYASPEQVSGDPEGVDQRTDVYSLGVVLYELLAGKPPYSAIGSLQEVIHRITTSQPARPDGAGNHGVDEELWTIIGKAMTKDRERRYQSAGALADDLRHYLAGEAIDAKRDSTLYVLRKAVQKHRKVVTIVTVGTAIVVLTIVVAAIVAGESLSSARYANEREQREKDLAAAESQRAGAASAFLLKVLPPHSLDPASPAARYASDGVDLMQGKLELGLVADRPELEATLQRIMGDVSAQIDSPAWAEISKRAALIRNHAEHGEEHWSVGQSLHDLAAVVLAREHPANAEPYARQALAIRTKLFGVESSEAAETRDLLAQILLAQGNLDEAERLVASSPAVPRVGHPEDDSAIAQSLDTRAALMLKRGRFPEAGRDALAALVSRLSREDDDAPKVALSLERLAEVADSSEGPPELARIRAALSVTQPSDLALRLRNLARDLQRQPDKQGAEAPLSPALRDLLGLKRELLGPDHRAVGHTLALLAWVLEKLENNSSEAVLCYEQAAPMIEHEFGPDHIALANLFQHLSECRYHLGDYAGAIKPAERSLTIWNHQPPEATDRVQALASHRYYARLLDLSGQYLEAEQEYRACADEAKEAVGSKHSLYGWVQSQRGWALMHLGKFEEAEACTRQGMGIILDDLQGTANPAASRLPEAQLCLGAVLVRRGKFEEAEPMLLGAWEWLKNEGPGAGENRSLRQAVVADLVTVSEHRGDDAAASRWRKKLDSRSP